MAMIRPGGQLRPSALFARLPFDVTVVIFACVLSACSILVTTDGLTGVEAADGGPSDAVASAESSRPDAATDAEAAAQADADGSCAAECPADASPGVAFTYATFSSTIGFSVNGSATVANGMLRVAPAIANTRGSIYYGNAVAVDASTSFRTNFSFALSSCAGPGGGGDGFAFVLQNIGVTALSPEGAAGGGGSGLGYQAVGRSVAVEFDALNSGAAYGDPNDNHIGIHANGLMANHLATASNIPNLRTSGVLQTWIDYDGKTKILTVYVATSSTKPTVPNVSYEIDIPSQVGSRMFAGFSAASGSDLCNFDISSWQFSSP